MCKPLVLLSLILLAVSAEAVRHVGFQTDAFNRAYPVSYARNMVFSPASFEVDCALVAESLDTIPKAHVSEMLGVVIDFESAYRPILEAFASPTNGFSFVAARGFCVPDIKTARPDHRQHLERAYGAEIMRISSAHGAESWFRASMNGEMEDFFLPPDAMGNSRYSFYDLVSFRASWQDPFPTSNTRKLAFTPIGETNSVPVSCMSDVRVADTWENDEYTLLSLPLKGDSVFYAMLPKKGYGLAPARADISSVEIDRILNVMKSLTEKGVSHGPCAIVIPRLDIYSSLDFSGILRYFRIPTKGLVHLAGDASAREFVQHVRFQLFEHAWDEPPLERKPDAEVLPITSGVKRLIFNRPFLFFVYHVKTETVLVAGQFSGRE